MGIAGYVFAALNAVLAVAFLFLAAADWGARQVWARAAFKHELALHGLPLDEGDLGWRLPERPVTDELPQELAAEHFADLSATGGEELGGSAVRTQYEEVKRVKDKVSKIVNDAVAAGDLDKARAALKRFLVPLARTPVERAELLNKIEGNKAGEAAKAEDITALTGDLSARFDTAAKSPLAEADRETQRDAVANLLFRLDPAPAADTEEARWDARKAWRARVQAVVGAAAFARAVDTAAMDLASVNQSVKRAVVADQFSFLEEYNALLARLPVEAGRLKALEKSLAEQKAITEQHDKLVKARADELKQLEMTLDDARKATREEFEKVAALEKQLFDVLRRKGKAEEENVALEKQLRELETAATTRADGK